MNASNSTLRVFEKLILRILFWNQLYAPSIGGVEIFTHRLALRLRERGHDIAVIADRHSGTLAEAETIDGIRVFRMPFRSVLSGAASGPLAAGEAISALLAAIDAAKREFRPDFVHVNMTDGSAFFHLRTQRQRIPTLVAFHCPLTPNFGGKGFLATLMNSAVANVAMSRTAATNISQMTGYPREKLRVIPPGIPSEAFERRQDDFSQNPPCVTFLGRLVRDKGADVAIAAAKLLRQQGYQFSLSIVGDGPERPVLEALVDDFELRGCVNFLGHVNDSDRRALLTGSHVLVVPSRNNEPFGMVAVEGAMSGLPVIASDVGALPEVVQHGETGVIVPPEDPRALAGTLLTLLGDRKRCTSLGSAGYARAIQAYNLDVTTMEYEKIYLEHCRGFAA